MNQAENENVRKKIKIFLTNSVFISILLISRYILYNPIFDS